MIFLDQINELSDTLSMTQYTQKSKLKSQDYTSRHKWILNDIEVEILD